MTCRLKTNVKTKVGAVYYFLLIFTCRCLWLAASVNTVNRIIVVTGSSAGD